MEKMVQYSELDATLFLLVLYQLRRIFNTLVQEKFISSNWKYIQPSHYWWVQLMEWFDTAQENFEPGLKSRIDSRHY